MEENKDIEKLDAFAKKYVKEINSEKISKDFTASLMHKIVVEHQKNVFTSKALISKKSWFVIALSVLAIILIPFKPSDKSLISLPEINFSFLNKNLFPDFVVSNIVLYAVVLFGLLFFAQVIFLKNHFNKRFE